MKRSSSGFSTRRSRSIKVLHADVCLDEALVKRFFNEALALQHLDHPHIVKILHCERQPDGSPFMILEWFPCDLHRVLCRVSGEKGKNGGLALDVAATIAVQIGQALCALHEQGLVHRDLKPANVLMSHENPALATVKLADLGLAKRLGFGAGVAEKTGVIPSLHVSTAQRARLGTWEYMAPEQWTEAKKVDAKADVYSLGVLLFQMLVGRLPFVATEQQHWMYYHCIEAPPLHLLEEQAPDHLRDLVGRMLSKKGRARPTMQEVIEGLVGST